MLDQYKYTVLGSSSPNEKIPSTILMPKVTKCLKLNKLQLEGEIKEHSEETPYAVIPGRDCVH